MRCTLFAASQREGRREKERVKSSAVAGRASENGGNETATGKQLEFLSLIIHRSEREGREGCTQTDTGRKKIIACLLWTTEEGKSGEESVRGCEGTRGNQQQQSDSRRDHRKRLTPSSSVVQECTRLAHQAREPADGRIRI